MQETKKDPKVYEISYLIPSSVPDEKVSTENDALKKIILDTGASIIAEEAPHKEALAYTMRKKTVSGSYNKFDEAYFGWVKFEVDAEKIEGVKKAFDTHQSVLRFMIISTVRENTYLGKRASAIAESIGIKPESAEPVKAEEKTEEKKESAPASIEEMDKSIDEMVKEAI